MIRTVNALSKKQENQNRILSVFSLPQDVICGETVMTFIGRQRLKIENYRSILIYGENEIKIQGKQYQVRVGGKNLWIRYYDKDEMEICGRIDSVCLE